MTMIIETDSHLQRLLARDTEDLGAEEVFHFISSMFFICSATTTVEHKV